jgi:hypothetical protein
MINSWSTFTNTYKEQSLFFNPMIPSNGNRQIKNEPNVNDYQKYNWLFGVR